MLASKPDSPTGDSAGMLTQEAFGFPEYRGIVLNRSLIVSVVVRSCYVGVLDVTTDPIHFLEHFWLPLRHHGLKPVSVRQNVVWLILLAHA